MIVNVRLDLSDGERRAIASAIAGKEVAKLATRKDVIAYVQGAIERTTILDIFPEEAPRVLQMSATEEAEAERLRALGHDESYIRGWLQVGRK